MQDRDDRHDLAAEISLPLGAVGRLAPQPWMDAAETRAVMDVLGAAGGEPRFVGGCVRDALLHRPVKDIDIATPLPPERVMAALEAADIRVIPTGLAHGTVTAVIGKAHFEITTLRRDVETFGRHATVAFSDDWREDAARRDFTINALSCEPDGTIHDPFGGLDDLGQGRVRFVGNALQRIDEDVLRLLRFFRFFAYYGRPPADPQALSACRARAHRLPELSGERVRGEILRLLQAPDPAPVVMIMRGEHVLDPILPELADIGRLRLLVWLETRAIRVAGVASDALRRLAALMPADGAAAASLAERLRLSNHQRDRLIAAVAPEPPLPHDLDQKGLRRLLHRLGVETFRDRALLDWAGTLALASRLPRPETEARIALLEATAAWQPVAFPLKGRDVAAHGIASGPAMGRLLKAVEAWWEDGGCLADRAACLAELARRIDS